MTFKEFSSTHDAPAKAKPDKDAGNKSKAPPAGARVPAQPDSTPAKATHEPRS